MVRYTDFDSNSRCMAYFTSRTNAMGFARDNDGDLYRRRADGGYAYAGAFADSGEAGEG